MANNSLLERLEGLDARFEEIQTLITDPSVIADQKRYVKLSKEYKSLENLLKVTHQYKKLSQDLDDSFEFNSHNSDTTGDGQLGINDVSVLINYLLTNTWPK